MSFFDSMTGTAKKKSSTLDLDDPLPEDDDLPPIGETESPLTTWILDQKDAGQSDQQIVTDLQANGYTPEQIDDAMMQAGIAGGVEPMRNPSIPSRTPTRFSEDDDMSMKDMAQVETLIEEHLKSVQDEVDSLKNWQIKVDGDLQKLEGSLEEVSNLVRETRDMEREKFSSYDKHLSAVKVELKATQEVFKKGLPEFTKGIQELNRMLKKR